MRRLFILLFMMCSLLALHAQNQLPVNGKFQLLPLPYSTSALEPYIGRETMETHWGKHVQTYVDNVNSMVGNSGQQGQSLEDIIKNSDGKLYNNAAQVWNHNLFFSIMSPTPQKTPTGDLANAINRSFGSLEKFKEAFNKAATDVFGSGWAWLIEKNNGTLEIKQTPNGNCPIDEGNPLIGLDVWEHAYYLDYKNKRADYIHAFWNVLDWKAVEARYKR